MIGINPTNIVATLLADEPTGTKILPHSAGARGGASAVYRARHQSPSNDAKVVGILLNTRNMALRSTGSAQELQNLQIYLKALLQHHTIVNGLAVKGVQQVSPIQLTAINSTLTSINACSPNLVVYSVNSQNILSVGATLANAHIAVAARIAVLTIAQTAPKTGTPTPATVADTPPSETPATELPAAATPRIDIPAPKLSYLRHTNGILFTAIVILLSAALVVYLGEKPQVVPNPNYDSQLQALDHTKDAIGSLIGFIDQQKKQIQLSQQAVDALKTEEGRMHPLVEADRKVIDAMFAVQEQRNQAIQSHERWIGFGLGVLASIIASSIISLIALIVKKRRREKTT